MKGHSDADVVCHALADAFLGAAGLGDIGQHFPDTDERWAGANSLQLLELCVEMANGAGLSLLNADVTVVAEIPRLAPYVDAMTTQLRTVARGDVSVKVKRAEGLGALGRAEGIACFAVALLGDQSEGSS